MVERQDIDALLIGALYGELTPADEARLQTHFESHPGDRTALAALTDTRQAVRESRILKVQLDPPQSVSAMLLQEAARRAPKKVAQRDEHESWFARFMRSFVAHPAMAAAAMLVIVVGVAGTMYLRKGDQFADKTVESRPNVTAMSPAAGSASANTVAGDQVAAETEAKQLQQQAGSGSGYQVGLAGDGDDESAINRAKGAKNDSEGKLGRAESSGSGSSYIEVRPATREPKELPDPGKPAKKSSAPAPKKPLANKPGASADSDGFGGGAAGASKPADPAPSPENQAPQAAPAPPPPPPTGGAPAKTGEKAKLEDTRTAPKSDPKPEPKADNTQVVRDLHARLVTQAKAGNCREAASLAIEISNRSRAYYIANVENDRSLKSCKAYIAAELERESERTQKRAAPKRGDEPARPSESQK